MDVRRPILSLLIAVGLAVPAMPAAGHSCRGDSCPLHLRQADPSCADAGTETDSCCKAPSEDDAGERDCCANGGCECMCCGLPAVTAVVRSTPTPVTIAPISIPVALRRSALSPQDAVGALLRPPQS